MNFISVDGWNGKDCAQFILDAAGTTTFAYAPYGNLTTETWGGLGNRVLTRHWDAYGRSLGYSVNGSRRTTLGYDAATGRLVSMNADGDLAWEYLEGSHLKKRLAYPNGVTVDYIYEPNRDLPTGVRNHCGETVYSEYLYANDALGRRTAKNNEQYGYNARSELIEATGNGNYAYAFDDIGNRLSSVEPTATMTCAANALNQYTEITSQTSQTSQASFDADGNQTLVQTATGIWSVTYNAENRPVRWTRGNTEVTMDFDSMGRRTYYKETENGQQVTFTRFFYDGYLMIQQLFSDAPYDVYKEFIWDPAETVATKPLCFRQNGQAATFLTHDGNKNVTDMIRVAPHNDSVGHYDYAPFGAVTAQTGSRAATNPYRFSSEFVDDTLGLAYYNYRHYEPTTGRWLSRDPVFERAEFDGRIRLQLPGGVQSDNLYLHSENSPIMSEDVLGLLPWGQKKGQKKGQKGQSLLI